MGTSVQGYVGPRHARPRPPLTEGLLRRAGLAALGIVLMAIAAGALFWVVLKTAPMFQDLNQPGNQLPQSLGISGTPVPAPALSPADGA